MRNLTKNILIITVLLYACDRKQNSVKESPKKEWQLVLNEEFDGDVYDPTYWTSYRSQGCSSAWNKYVVANDPSLAEVKDGALHLRARWNEDTNLPETGAIQTLNKFSFKYGKMEVKAKFSRSGNGGWPAIWLMPQTPVFQGWPNGGEIDVMERLNDDSYVHQVIHLSTSIGTELKPSPHKITNIDKSDYNTYGIIKEKNCIEFFVNGNSTLVCQKNSVNGQMWPFETDFYIILNYACADKGTSGVNFWPGNVSSIANFPYEMEVDYVKIWKCE